MIPTVPVTCVAHDDGGQPIPGAIFTAVLNTIELYQGLVVPEQVSGVADAGGSCVLNLWPNELGSRSSYYIVSGVNPDTGLEFVRGSAVVPNAPCSLSGILLLPPFPAVDAAQAAVAQAQAAAASAANASRLTIGTVSTGTPAATITGPAGAQQLNLTLPEAGGGGGAVSSVAGRTGAITLSSADITDTTAAGRALLDDADAAAQRATLGLGDAATKNTGTTAGTVAAGDDERMSDARTPTSHTHALADLTQSSASTGQVATWNGTAWVPATPSSGGEGARWIGAGELIPRVTTGAGIDGEELSTNKINLDYLAFDAGTAEYAQASFSWPSGMATMTAKTYWTAASGSGAVVWGVQARCYADDDALDQAQGTAQTVTDTLLAASDTHISAATSAITPGGTVATGNLCVVQVYRDATNGSDTLAVDARLIGIRLEFSA